MNSNKMQYLEYLLNIQITWIKSTDTKASILLAIIAAFFTLCDYLKLLNPSTFANKCCYLVFIMISIILIVIGALSFLFTIMPSLRITKADDKSYLYFGSIHNMNNFHSKLKKNLNNNFNPIDDFLNQIKIDADIANNKMKVLKFGAWLLTIGLIIFVISIIIEKLM